MHVSTPIASPFPDLSIEIFFGSSVVAMGVLTIDNGVVARLHDASQIIFEIYYRGMTLSSEIPKVTGRQGKDRELQVEPPFRN